MAESGLVTFSTGALEFGLQLVNLEAAVWSGHFPPHVTRGGNEWSDSTRVAVLDQRDLPRTPHNMAR
jgi:hypothetical protein